MPVTICRIIANTVALPKRTSSWPRRNVFGQESLVSVTKPVRWSSQSNMLLHSLRLTDAQDDVSACSACIRSTSTRLCRCSRAAAAGRAARRRPATCVPMLVNSERGRADELFCASTTRNGNRVRADRLKIVSQVDHRVRDLVEPSKSSGRWARNSASSDLIAQTNSSSSSAEITVDLMQRERHLDRRRGRLLEGGPLVGRQGAPLAAVASEAGSASRSRDGERHGDDAAEAITALTMKSAGSVPPAFPIL